MVTHSFLQRGWDTLFPAEAHDRVDEVEVRQLSVEPFQFDVHSADDVSAQLQVDGGLNRAAATRELASDDDCNTALASAQNPHIIHVNTEEFQTHIQMASSGTRPATLAFQSLRVQLRER